MGSGRAVGSVGLLDLPIYLVLCGSHIRFFVENVLAGPAYGRNTGAWQLQPLGYRQVASFFPNWPHEDHLRAYALVGGMPHCLLQLDADRSLAWNIQHNLLRPGSVLYREAELLESGSGGTMIATIALPGRRAAVRLPHQNGEPDSLAGNVRECILCTCCTFLRGDRRWQQPQNAQCSMK